MDDEDRTFYVSTRIAQTFNAIRPIVHTLSEEGYNWAEISSALSLMVAAINSRVDEGLDHGVHIDIEELLDGMFDDDDEGAGFYS